MFEKEVTNNEDENTKNIGVPTVELLEKQLGWQSVFAQDEEKL